MTESFLHYVWQFQYFDKNNLMTVDGEPVSVFNPGILNHHAGPDFSNARIRIGDVEWVGTVEIHINASGWLEHKHDEDQAYENVVLHVVWKNDKAVCRRDNSMLPTLELKNRIDEKLLLRYRKLVNSPEAIPCAKSFSGVDSITKLSMLDKALFHRLERRLDEILQLYQFNQNDWEETCYQLLGRNFGFKVNSDPFFQLVQSLPYKVILKHADKLYQVESLLFGHAGFLDENSDEEYFLLLKREYNLLSKKYSLSEKQLHVAQWRFLRLRPSNFPTLRIAQFASLIASTKHIFSRLLDARSYADLKQIFSVCQSAYWQSHYQFKDSEQEKIPALGSMSIDNIVINTVVPLLVTYGKSIGDQSLIDRAVTFLSQIPPEQNSITRKWVSVNQSVQTAFDSQALIELYNNFCLRKQCLDCNIGASMIKPVRC